MMRMARPKAPAVENENVTTSPSDRYTPDGAFVQAPPEQLAAASELVSVSVAPVRLRDVTVRVEVFVTHPSEASLHVGGGVYTTCPG